MGQTGATAEDPESEGSCGVGQNKSVAEPLIKKPVRMFFSPPSRDNGRMRRCCSREYFLSMKGSYLERKLDEEGFLWRLTIVRGAAGAEDNVRLFVLGLGGA